MPGGADSASDISASAISLLPSLSRPRESQTATCTSIPAEAIQQVIIYHTTRLQCGICRDGAGESEALGPQLAGERLGGGGLGGHIGQGDRRVHLASRVVRI